MNKLINFFKQTQAEFKGVRKGAITVMCYLEFIVVVALVGLSLVLGLQVGLSNSLVDRAIEIKDEAVEKQDEAERNAEYYQALFEAIREEFDLYQEEHPPKGTSISKDTKVNKIITNPDELANFMEAKSLDKFYDPMQVYELGKKYSIDPGFAIATFALETEWGRSNVFQTCCNPAGIKSGSDYRDYKTLRDGLEDMYRLLSRYVNGSISYVGKRDTVGQIRDVWSSAEDTDEIIRLWRSVYD